MNSGTLDLACEWRELLVGGFAGMLEYGQTQIPCIMKQEQSSSVKTSTSTALNSKQMTNGVMISSDPLHERSCKVLALIDLNDPPVNFGTRVVMATRAIPSIYGRHKFILS